MIALMPKPASTPPNADSKRSLTVIETNENFIAIKKAMTLTIILKNAAENEDDKWKYFLVNTLKEMEIIQDKQPIEEVLVLPLKQKKILKYEYNLE